MIGPLMVDVAGLALTEDDREVLGHPLVGGVILFARNYHDRDQLRALCADIAALPRRRLLIAVDHEGGRVQRFRVGFSDVPPMASLGRCYAHDRRRALEDARVWGGRIAAELGEAGVDLCFAPVLDLDWGVSTIIGDRAFGADPEMVARLALAFKAGLNARGMAATGKHFPGHGAVLADSHVELPVDQRPWSEIEAADLQPFQLLIDAGIESLMMAHVRYTAVDEIPASLSPRWIHGILRRRFGFSGAVFCDDLSMNGAASVGTLEARARMALEAGCDMLPVCNDREGAVRLLDGLRDFTPPADADRRLRRLYLKGGAA